MKAFTKFSYWNPLLCHKIDVVTDNEVMEKMFIEQLLSVETMMHIGNVIITQETDDIDESILLRVKKSILDPNINIIASNMMIDKFEEVIYLMGCNYKMKFKKLMMLSTKLSDEDMIESIIKMLVFVTKYRSKYKFDYIMCSKIFRPDSMISVNNEFYDRR